MRRAVVTLLPILLLCAGCGEDDSCSPFGSPIIRERVALVAVVESHERVSSEWSALYNLKRDVAIPVIAQLIGVSQTELTDLTLTEIIDRYLEEWAIQRLDHISRNRYARFTSLTDGDATANRYLETVEEFSRDGCLVDTIFILHGSSNSVWFMDGSKDIRILTADVAARGIPMRALYQTCCYGRDMIDDWERIGVSAVNGTKGLNGINMLSPMFFLQRWINGSPFDQAVQAAMQDEITAVRAYERQLGLESLLITADTIAQSEQFVGGQKPGLLWSDFSTFPPPS